MKRGWLFAAAVVVLIGVSAITYRLQKQEPAVYDGMHHASQGDKSVYGVLPVASGKSSGIRGAIVSHHLLIGDHIAETFASMGSEDTTTVVIIGPDHFRRGPGSILVSRYPYETPWGTIEPDLPFIDDLIDDGIGQEDEYVFEIEHSIASVVPYVKYYFPNAKIVPIVLQRNVASAKSKELGTYLADKLPDDSVVIASVDFSHHQGITAGAFHDAKSVETIRTFDFASLPRLEIDSPPSITALLHYLDEKGARRPVSFLNTNSVQFLNIPDSEDVTSYLLATFADGKKEGTGAVSILAVGDVMLGRGVSEALDEGVDLFERFRAVEGNFLKGFDIFIANLEGPITDAEDCQDKDITFAFDPSVAKVLKENALTHVNLANNHTLDCGPEGLTDTKRYLDESGIKYVGGGTLAESTRTEVVAGKRIATLGIDRTTAPLTSDIVYSHIRSLDQTNDYVVVEIHWGIEYDSTESTSQKEFAHGLIDSGADAVIGHHPHVAQPIEFYHGKPIFYSLGNFIFDQIGKEVNTGIAAGVVFKEKGTEVFVFPYTINAEHQPGLMPFVEAQTYCRSMDINIPSGVTDECILKSW